MSQIADNAPLTGTEATLPDQRSGVRVEAVDLVRAVADGTRILDGVSFSIAPGELVGIVGGSGAGKTTLLEALAGVSAADSGSVRFDGVDIYRQLELFRSVLGYVPQDDIIHTELSLARTLRYAARLRLGGRPSAEQVDRAVGDALDVLDLAGRADVRVRDLSGGQRKRASIAVELLTDPHVFFLDEPTSGLDPATDAELLRLLRRLADTGTTVVFTTHAVQDLAACDRIVFLAPGGRLAFVGTLREALRHFRVKTPEAIYERLLDDAGAPATEPVPAGSGTPPPARPHVGPVRQFAVLTARTFETLARNRLTMAILVGSPAMVVAMFAVLFRAGSFDPVHPDASSIVMIVFWISFGAFFFGLTYGLLQICPERPILDREHLVGLRLGPYLASKVSVLLPFLVVVDVAMLAVLRGLDRLPPADLGTYVSLGVTLLLDGAAGLTLGLLTSAAVGNPSQATLALPMLCFPAVLFSGAILPVHVMARVGAAISAVMPTRWAFEAVGHDLGVRGLLLHGRSPLGPPLIASYGNAGVHSTGTYWLFLAAFCAVFLAAAWLTLAGLRRR